MRLFPRSCRAANDETRPRPESILGERSFLALPLRATQIPSARALQRTTRNGSSAGLRVSPLGSNRVTCDGSEDENALHPAEISTGSEHHEYNPSKLLVDDITGDVEIACYDAWSNHHFIAHCRTGWSPYDRSAVTLRARPSSQQ